MAQRTLGLCGLVSMLFACPMACGGDDDSASGSSGGTTGTGAHAATGGSGAQGGSGGSVAGGAGGVAGGGGTSGAGGAGGAGADASADAVVENDSSSGGTGTGGTSSDASTGGVGGVDASLGGTGGAGAGPADAGPPDVPPLPDGPPPVTCTLPDAGANDAGAPCVPKYTLHLAPVEVMEQVGVRAINESGQIAGTTTGAAYRYTPGQPLETSFGGSSFPSAEDIDDNGAIVGGWNAFRWDPPGATPAGGWSVGLHLLPQGNVAFAVAKSGWVVGHGDLPGGGTGPTIWSASGAPTFPALPSQCYPKGMNANDINSDQYVVGQCMVGDGTFPVRFGAGVHSALVLGGTPPAPGIAYRVNALNRAVGYAWGSSGMRATLWEANGSAKNLGALDSAPTTHSIAHDIADSGQVVGRSRADACVNGWPALGEYAVAWDSAGQIHDLNTLACTRLTGDAASTAPVAGGACGSNWSKAQLVRANAVNEKGQIAGVAWNCTTQRYEPFILTPL